MNQINIRAHHLLCIQGYQGYGYSEQFTENMNQIIEKIKNNDVKIRLVNSKDSICEKCPNLNENLCKNLDENSKIEYMDNYILNKLQYKGNEVNFNEIVRKLNKTLKKDEILNLCKDCYWTKECLLYQKYEI